MILHSVKKNKSLTYLLIIILLTSAYKLYLSYPLDPISGFGDSTGRITELIKHFPSSYTWVTSHIWLPFYFIFYSIPLHFSFSFIGLIAFQHLLSSLICVVIYLSAKNHFSIKNPFLPVILFALMPLNTHLTDSVFSEVSFTLFIISAAYFFTNYERNKKTIDFLLSTILMLFASMTRYEAWILYPSFLLYIIYKTRNSKLFILASVPFSLCVYLLELELNKIGLGNFSGISENHIESGAVNLFMGAESLLQKLKIVFRFHLWNLGLFIFIFPIVFLKSRKNKLNIYTFFTFALWSGVFFGSLTDNIALFQRYWFPSLSFLALLSFCFFDKISTKTLLIIFIASTSFQFYQAPNLHRISKKFPTNSVFKFLKTQHAKNIYIDEYKRIYLFQAFEVHNLFSGEELVIYKLDDEISPSLPNDQFAKQQELDFLSKYQKHNFDHIVLIKHSMLYKLIIEKNIIPITEQWQLDYKVGDFIIYKRLN